MSADSQIVVPPSFIDLFTDARGRLRVSPQELTARYELCEDLAHHLSEQAAHIHHGYGGPEREDILLRMHAGLTQAEAGVPAAQARWITLRLAELMQWPAPTLPDLAGEPDPV